MEIFKPFWDPLTSIFITSSINLRFHCLSFSPQHCLKSLIVGQNGHFLSPGHRVRNSNVHTLVSQAQDNSFNCFGDKLYRIVHCVLQSGNHKKSWVFEWTVELKKRRPFGPCLSVSKFKCPNISVLKMQKPFKVWFW